MICAIELIFPIPKWFSQFLGYLGSTNNCTASRELCDGGRTHFRICVWGGEGSERDAEEGRDGPWVTQGMSLGSREVVYVCVCVCVCVCVYVSHTPCVCLCVSLSMTNKEAQGGADRQKRVGERVDD